MSLLQGNWTLVLRKGCLVSKDTKSLRRVLVSHARAQRSMSSPAQVPKSNNQETPQNPQQYPPVMEVWDRLEICKACPKGSLHVAGFPTKCDECGCLIQAKAMFPMFHCPLGKW